MTLLTLLNLIVANLWVKINNINELQKNNNYD